MTGRNCYDQTCQIELGRELAAEKTLSAQVLKMGSRCTVASTLYDLKRAATEAASTEHGKSTVAAHLSYASASRGLTVLQVGCDPKSDSTHALLTDYATPILDVLRQKEFDYDAIEPAEIIRKTPLAFERGCAIDCAEAGKPEPGIGCAGK